MIRIWRCKDCDKAITKNRIRCRKCYEKTIKGKGNPNYKNGHTLRVFKCKNCNKILLKPKAKRCGSCHALNRFKNPKNNNNYIDGRSRYPYPSVFSRELKEKIRTRDNFECQNCGITNEEHLNIFGYNLCIHHIDYNKNNCKENNLITTCCYCNSRANFNRSYWIIFYKNKILNLIKEIA